MKSDVDLWLETVSRFGSDNSIETLLDVLKWSFDLKVFLEQLKVELRSTVSKSTNRSTSTCLDRLRGRCMPWYEQI